MSQIAKPAPKITLPSDTLAEQTLQTLGTFLAIVASSSDALTHQRAAQKALAELKQLRNCSKKKEKH